MCERGVNHAQFRLAVCVSYVHWSKVFRAEPCEALLGNRNAHFLHGIQMRHFGENLFLFRVDHEQGEIFCVEASQDLMAEVEQDLIEIGGGENL
ncbi:MAG: hypothetical protein UZ03_NOB001002349 [Nitrospira sp. OLB3]|nr:MAG: hypothetical protein UZ03_NOB001002349 [Nitrospira sp. OLB3]